MFSLLLLLTLIGVIFFTRRLQQLLHNIPQRYWLSLGGGISLAYVFTAFLAEVTELQQHLMPLEVPVLGYLIEHIHLLMLLGIVTVYGLEGLAQSSKQGLFAKTHGARMAQLPVADHRFGYPPQHRL
ncbi:hypothetical protein [Thermostichus sp. OS-CIW-26]|jgi:drug/metabolite transporter (DMT)-like permease